MTSEANLMDFLSDSCAGGYWRYDEVERASTFQWYAVSDFGSIIFGVLTRQSCLLSLVSLMLSLQFRLTGVVVSALSYLVLSC